MLPTCYLLHTLKKDIFEEQANTFKMNASFGFILRNMDSEEFRYFHASNNEGKLFEEPHLIRNKEDFNQALEELKHEDILEWVKQQRPNSKWVVVSITNLTVYVTKVLNHPLIGCIEKSLPDYIKYNKGVIGLARNPFSFQLLKDNKCFFRALAMTQGPKTAKELTTKSNAFYSQAVAVLGDLSKGVKLEDLPLLEVLFSINIVVYSLRESEEDKSVSAVFIRRSHRNFPQTLYLNLFENHFSYICDFDIYAHSFKCERCEKMWKTRKQLERHLKTNCTQVTLEKYVGGSYQPPRTVFEELDDYLVEVPEALRYYPYRITYDFETYFALSNLPVNTEKVEWRREHVPLSVSVASNVPGYEDPMCFITKGNPVDLVLEMVSYMHLIQQKAEALLVAQHESYLKELDELIHVMNSLEGGEGKHPLEKVKESYESWLKQIPVLGFNSGSYDLNLIKPHLVEVLSMVDPVGFVVKRCNNFMCMTTKRLKLLDIRNYLAPGFNYANYLKAYKCSQDKGYFPYVWMDSLEKLQETQLPEQKDFWTELTQKSISSEEYQVCQDAWKKHGMKTFQDYLTWYNNLDVVPFLEALEKQVKFYREELKVDMFKDGISVPGLTLKYLFNSIDHTQENFVLFNEKDKDLHKTVKDNLVGGPSIIFHRYHEVGKTYICGGKVCKGVVGYDANALYLSCFMKDMPTGMYTRRRAETGFKPEVPDIHGKMAAEWLDWESKERRVFIRHKYNGKEKIIGKKYVCVDGWCAETNTVFQFHGCFWHGHEYQEAKGKFVNDIKHKTMEQLRSETKQISDYIQNCGYCLEEKWECEWKREKNQDMEKREFVRQRKSSSLENRREMTEKQVLQCVKEGTLFGMVECDIHVPEHLRGYFAEMPPIFKNTEVRLEDVSAGMREYAEQNHLMKQGRKT